jgi:hypothetical protein
VRGLIQDATQAIAKLDAAPDAEREKFFSLLSLRTELR